MYNCIIVGTDGSPTASLAVETAARMARAHHATLLVASAYVPRLTMEQKTSWHELPEDVYWRVSAGSKAEAVAADAVDRARNAGGGRIDVSGRAEPGDAVDVMLDLADKMQADVVVVGTRPRPGLGRLRGSVARDLSRRAGCDVLIVDTVGRETV